MRFIDQQMQLASTVDQDDIRTRSSTNQKLPVWRKILVSLATRTKNENLDQYLMLDHKPLSDVIRTGETFDAIFSKRVKSNQTQPISLDDFDKLKVIGKGGFAEKVYLARKKDTG